MIKIPVCKAEGKDDSEHRRLFYSYVGKRSLVDGVRPVSKSILERFEKMLPEDELATLIHEITGVAGDKVAAGEVLYRETALRLDQIFADSTCVKANIHSPVDRMLLRDATRTLIGAIIQVRKQGLKHRIGPPERFINEMNKLCIEMTHTHKRKDGKKMRKKLFRRMKNLMKTIDGHVRNYHTLLEERWAEIDWSNLQTEVVLDQIQGVLDQLPTGHSSGTRTPRRQLR